MHSVTGGFLVRFVAFWACVHDRILSRVYSGECDLKDLDVIIIISFFFAVISVTNCLTYGLLQKLKRGTDTLSPESRPCPFQ